MSTAQSYFLQETIAFARTLPIPDARLYLRGLLESLGDCAEAHEILHAFTLLDESDRQLELLGKKS